MKFFKNRIVAIALTALTVAGCLGYGWYSRSVPVPKATFGDWSYDGAHILSEETEQLIDGYNARWDEEYDGVTIGLCREDFFQINLPREPFDAWARYVLTEEGQVWPNPDLIS